MNLEPHSNPALVVGVLTSPYIGVIYYCLY
jgi:hypothetical protein